MNLSRRQALQAAAAGGMMALLPRVARAAPIEIWLTTIRNRKTKEFVLVQAPTAMAGWKWTGTQWANFPIDGAAFYIAKEGRVGTYPYGKYGPAYSAYEMCNDERYRRGLFAVPAYEDRVPIYNPEIRAVVLRRPPTTDPGWKWDYNGRGCWLRYDPNYGEIDGAYHTAADGVITTSRVIGTGDKWEYTYSPYSMSNDEKHRRGAFAKREFHWTTHRGVKFKVYDPHEIDVSGCR